MCTNLCNNNNNKSRVWLWGPGSTFRVVNSKHSRNIHSLCECNGNGQVSIFIHLSLSELLQGARQSSRHQELQVTEQLTPNTTLAPTPRSCSNQNFHHSNNRTESCVPNASKPISLRKSTSVSQSSFSSDAWFS